VLATAVAAISLLPYLLAYANTPPGHHFAGFFFIADDATTYLAKMQQGAGGAWAWNDPYTSEPHGGVFLFGFYLLFGHLSALLHLPLIATYHLARVSGAFALVLSVDRLGRRLLAPSMRGLALTLVVLASGLGFIAQMLGNPAVMGHQLEALDLHLPELSGFYSILAIPHFAWATALIVASLIGLLRLSDSPTWRTILVTGGLMTALTAIHPQMIPVIFLIWVAYRGVLFAWGERPGLRLIITELAAFAMTAPRARLQRVDPVPGPDHRRMGAPVAPPGARPVEPCVEPRPAAAGGGRRHRRRLAPPGSWARAGHGLAAASLAAALRT